MGIIGRKAKRTEVQTLAEFNGIYIEMDGSDNLRVRVPGREIPFTVHSSEGASERTMLSNPTILRIAFDTAANGSVEEISNELESTGHSRVVDKNPEDVLLEGCLDGYDRDRLALKVREFALAQPHLANGPLRR